MARVVSLTEAARLVPDAATIGLVPSMPAATLARELVRRGARRLHLVSVPSGNLVVDLLIGAGCADTVDTSGVSIGEISYAPWFRRRAQDGSLRVNDATCPALINQVRAAAMGVPFLPIQGLIGSDFEKLRPDWKVIVDPFHPAARVALVPSLPVDVALLHAYRADRDGNVELYGGSEAALLARAASTVIVSAEEVLDRPLRSVRRGRTLLPARLVAAVAHAPRGSWPVDAPGLYPADFAAQEAYAEAAAAGGETWTRWLHGFLAGPEAPRFREGRLLAG